MRQYDPDRMRGQENQLAWWLSVNLPAILYVCRNELDDKKGVPGWILSDYDGSLVTANQVKISENSAPDITFRCYERKISGTSKNRWGGVTGINLSSSHVRIFYSQFSPCRWRSKFEKQHSSKLYSECDNFVPTFFFL